MTTFGCAGARWSSLALCQCMFISVSEEHSLCYILVPVCKH